MKKFITLLFAIFLAVTASAQSHIFPAYDSNNVFTGSNSFGGPFSLTALAPGCLAVGAGGVVSSTAGCGGAGLTSFMTRTTPAAVLLSTDVQSVLSTLTNCGLGTYSYNPATNTCIVAASSLFPVTTGLVYNTSTTAARTAISGTDFSNYNLGQLNNFRAALSNSANAPVHAVLIGDNDLNGLQVATLSNSIYSQLRANFGPANVNGLSGTGLVPVFGNGAGVHLNPEWTQTGTLTSSADLGPTQGAPNAFNSTAILTGTATSVTFNTVTGFNTLIVYGETSTDTSNGCSVVINGGTPHIVGNTTTGSPGVYRTAINQGLGTWSTTISGTSSGNCRLYGVEWTNNNSGIEIHRLAHAASASGAWGSNVAAQLAYIGAITPAPQLAVIMLGRYDNLNSSSLVTTTANFTNLISQLRVINPQMAVLIVDEPPMNTNGTGITPAQIKTLEQGFGTSANTAYISLGDSFGTYANANAIGVMNVDGININDKGSLYASDLIFSILNAGQLNGANVSGFATLNANTFLGMQTISTATNVPDISFISNGSGFDEGLAWNDGASFYPTTTALKWRLGKDSTNHFYGWNQTTSSNWLSVDPATNNVTLAGSLSGVNVLQATTVNGSQGNITNNFTVGGVLTAGSLNVAGPITSNSTLTLSISGSLPDTGMELYVPPGGGSNTLCFTLSGGCTFASGTHINGFLYNSGLPGDLEVFYGAGTTSDLLSFFPNNLGTSGNGSIIFDAFGNIQISSGFLNYDQAGIATPTVTGIGSSPVCQTHTCSIQSGIINVGIDGSSTGGSFLTLTSAQPRQTNLACFVSAPQDPGSSLSVAVTGTSTTILTFFLNNGSVYNTAAKTMKLQYSCSIL